MRKIREVLRLKYEAKCSHQQIAQATGLSKGAIANYVRRAVLAALGWPLPAELDDGALESLLFASTRPIGGGGQPQFAPPDCEYIHRELQRKGVTLQLLWEEYAAANGEGAYRYSQYCEHYRRYRKALKRSMRQVHRAGEKVFIDYSGTGIPVIDRDTGEIRFAALFVASLGASKYTFAECTWTQSLPDWIGSNVRMLEFFGCVPEIFVPDNLKSGVKTPCRYEPEANETYEDMANHFGAVIIPARPRKPKDKATVESHVCIVQRWIVARLRNVQFFSLMEANRAVAALLTNLNQRPFQKLPGSRASAFADIDRPAMKALPPYPYDYAEFCRPKVGIDYYVPVGPPDCKHFYSVPHQLVGEELFVKYTSRVVECYFKGRLVAAHARSHVRGAQTTDDHHLSDAHRKHKEWSPSRLLSWGESIGIGTHNAVQWHLDNRPHPEQGYRACLGLLNLAKVYGEQRLEAACRRALSMGAEPKRYRIVAILKAKLDQHPDLFEDADVEAPATPVTHENLRGAAYFEACTSNATTNGDQAS